MKKLIVLVTLAAALGCSREEPSFVPPDNAGSFKEPGRANGGKMGLQPRGIRRGATNFDQSGVQRFALPLNVSFEEIESALKARARYVDANGSVVAPVVELENGETPADSNIRLTAVERLNADQWYWLVVNVDAELSIVDPDFERIFDSGSWSAHFFTGSAPHVVRVELPPDDKKGSVYITLSEPINIGDLSRDKLVHSEDVAIGKCVLRGAECWAGGSWMSENVDLLLAVPQLPESWAVVVPGRVHGSGRSVAESRQFTKQADERGDGVRLSLGASTMKVVRDMRVWLEEEPPPGAQK